MQDRAAAGRHGVDLHHRRAHAHAGHQRLEGPLVLAVIVRDVGRGAAHVEADDPAEAGGARGLDGADDAARRAGEDAVLTLEGARLGQPAVRLHEEQPGRAQLAGDAVDVAAQDRREIGVDHRGVAAPDQLHQRADPVADRDLGESQPGGEVGQRLLVPDVAVAMQQHDGDRADPARMGRGEGALSRGEIDRPQHLALGGHPLVDLGHRLIEQLRQDDTAVEEPRPVLVGDAQLVGEAGGDRQQGAVALALEQRVGRHRGAHLDRGDRRGRDRGVGRQPEQLADALQGGVAIASGILRQQLVGDDRPVGAPRHHVGEGAAAIDPEFPAIHARLRSSHGESGRNSPAAANRFRPDAPGARLPHASSNPATVAHGGAPY
jgi:hypothetical protein